MEVVHLLPPSVALKLHILGVHQMKEDVAAFYIYSRWRPVSLRQLKSCENRSHCPHPPRNLVPPKKVKWAA
jgi:hypothetical protein